MNISLVYPKKRLSYRCRTEFLPEELTIVIFYILSLSNLILKSLLNISPFDKVQFRVFSLDSCWAATFNRFYC